MRSASRIGSVCLAMVLPVLLASCVRPQPSPMAMIEVGRTSFELESDGAGGCRKKAIPQTFLGKGGQQVQWTVTNGCDKDVTVHIERFAVKNGTGPDPWLRPPPPTSFGANDKDKTKVITGVLKPKNDVPPANHGFNVYTYIVRLVVNGKADATDPEIIIEWN